MVVFICDKNNFFYLLYKYQLLELRFGKQKGKKEEKFLLVAGRFAKGRHI